MINPISSAVPQTVQETAPTTPPPVKAQPATLPQDTVTINSSTAKPSGDVDRDGDSA